MSSIMSSSLTKYQCNILYNILCQTWMLGVGSEWDEVENIQTSFLVLQWWKQIHLQQAIVGMKNGSQRPTRCKGVHRWRIFRKHCILVSVRYQQ
jgi:hypothetical protein